MTTKPGLVRAYEPALRLLQRLMDAGAIVLGLYIACALYPQRWLERNTAAAAVAVFAYYLCAEITGLYRTWRGRSIREELQAVGSTWALVIPILLFTAFAAQQSKEYSRIVTLGWFFLAPCLLMSLRFIERRSLVLLRRSGRNSRTVAIAGCTEAGVRLARVLAQPDHGFRFVGFYDQRRPERRSADAECIAPVVGDLDVLVDSARRGVLDIVYIALPMQAEIRILEMIKRLADTTATVHYAPDFFAFDLLHARWSNLGDVPVVSILDSPFQGNAATLKRIEDMVLSLFILALISIPMFLIALVIKISSPGPVFFRQTRYGLNGRPIKVWKFRTMSVCEDGPVVQQASRNDSRITPFGAFLRRTSLDELPQFFNVLAGDMSIVGPRPHAVAHNEHYRTLIYGYMLRHKVKPGITGWAQVNGWRGETDTIQKMEKRVEHDLAYINNWNLWWDLQIIILTVFGRKKNLNAY